MYESELIHYGVKGMKWGVRRAIGKQAREHARNVGKIKKYKRKSNKLQTQINDLKEHNQYSDLADNLKFEKRKIDRMASSLQRVNDKLAKGLSPKDIARGKKEVTALKVFKIGLDTVTFATSVAYGISVVDKAAALSNIGINLPFSDRKR